MGPRFIRDAEVAAGFSPFGSVWRNAAAAGAELREEMRHLMPESAIDLLRVVLAQAWIQRDQLSPEIGAAGGAEKPRVPFHVNRSREFVGAEPREDFAGLRLQGGIASESDRRKCRREDEIQLL
jgi:hypothetical protein